MISSETDEALVEQARTDGEAFGILYERHVRQIYKYIYYRTGNAADAEDLTEKTFFQALNNLHRYQPRGVPFSAWLFRIAHNLVANWHRDTRRRHMVDLEDVSLETFAPTDNPVHAAEELEEHEELRQLVARLPMDRQRLLFLKFVEELPNAEIAVAMQRSEGAIKALLHRTITSMRNELVRPKRAKEKYGSRVKEGNPVTNH